MKAGGSPITAGGFSIWTFLTVEMATTPELRRAFNEHVNLK